MSHHYPYMVWYRRITRLYIDRDSTKMEILIANQLAVLSWFNEDFEEYKFIKKALEDVDEVDRIDVLASDEAANHTETPDVGPSTSSAAPAHTRHQHAPIPHLATETPDPPFMTQSGPLCHPSFPLTLNLPCGLPMLNSSPPHTPPPLTTTRP